MYKYCMGVFNQTFSRGLHGEKRTELHEIKGQPRHTLP